MKGFISHLDPCPANTYAHVVAPLISMGILVCEIKHLCKWLEDWGLIPESVVKAMPCWLRGLHKTTFFLSQVSVVLFDISLRRSWNKKEFCVTQQCYSTPGQWEEDRAEKTPHMKLKTCMHVNKSVKDQCSCSSHWYPRAFPVCSFALSWQVQW